MARLTSFCQDKNRPLPEVVVASKYGNVDQLRGLVAEGARCFGENRLQDGIQKMRDPLFSDAVVRWHFIGHLQSNKARQAVLHFSCIQSGDRLSLLEDLDRHAGDLGKRQDVLIQVNPAKEPAKHGFVLEELALHEARLFSFPNLRVLGIMAMAPYAEDSESVRPYFRETSRVFADLRERHPDMSVLSMGMSHDYTIAIEEGATMIRIGSLLFKEL